jgi:photosystem II stability/assembly factor-like uncharacterized protein
VGMVAITALVTAGCGGGQPDWTTRPVPRGIDTLNDVVCPSTTQCYAVGRYGTAGPGSIIGSSDGGDQWKLLMTAPEIQFSAIACPKSSTCIVGGEKKSLLPDEVPEAFVTTNDGVHWSSEAIPPLLGGVGGVACASVNVCLVIGGAAIARTTNGGMTWVSKSYPPDLASIDSVVCPTRSFCIVGGSSQGTASPGDSVGSPGSAVDLVSHDAGATWSRAVVAAPFVRTAGGDVSAATLGAISCSDARQCVGVIPSYLASSAGTGSLITTSDAGRTWRRGSTGVGWAISCVKTFCASVGFHTSTNDHLVGDAFISTDGGVNWSPSTIHTNQILTAVSCSSSPRCVAVGGNLPGAKSSVILTYP